MLCSKIASPFDNVAIWLLLMVLWAGISSCNNAVTRSARLRFDSSLVVKEVKLDGLRREKDKVWSNQGMIWSGWDLVWSGFVKISPDTVCLLRRITRSTLRLQAFNPDLDSLWATDIPVGKDEERFNIYSAKGTVFLFSQIKNVDDSIDVVGRAFSGSNGEVIKNNTMLLRVGEELRSEPYGRSPTVSHMTMPSSPTTMPGSASRSQSISVSYLPEMNGGYSVAFSPDSSYLMIWTVGEMQSEKKRGFFYRDNIVVVDSRMGKVQDRFMDLSAIILDHEKSPPPLEVDNEGAVYIQNMVKNDDSIFVTITRVPVGSVAPYPSIEKSFGADSLGYKPTIVSTSNLIVENGKGIVAVLFNKEKKDRKIREPINGVARIDWDFSDSHLAMNVTPFNSGLIRSAIEGLSTESAYLDNFILHSGLGTSLLLDVAKGDKGFVLLLFYDMKGEFKWVQSYSRPDNERIWIICEPGDFLTVLHGEYRSRGLYLQVTDLKSDGATMSKALTPKKRGASTHGLIGFSPTHYFFVIDGNKDQLRLFSVQIP